jgi:hypothetical protein
MGKIRSKVDAKLSDMRLCGIESSYFSHEEEVKERLDFLLFSLQVNI